ncbi:hypothetical protein J6590_005722 [Homalodisca vitripennis]|nr:hypothetical protein J6590_005722 [Homalodisca vitripennis]
MQAHQQATFLQRGQGDTSGSLVQRHPVVWPNWSVINSSLERPGKPVCDESITPPDEIPEIASTSTSTATSVSPLTGGLPPGRARTHEVTPTFGSLPAACYLPSDPLLSDSCRESRVLSSLQTRFD